MPFTSRRMVLSLLTVVFALLLAMAALLGVSLNRRQRLEDVTADFQRNQKQQEGQIYRLQKLLQNCDTLGTIRTDTTPKNTPVF